LKEASRTFHILTYAPELFKIFILPSELQSFISFQTLTLNQLILVPNFSGSHSLSLRAIPILMIVAIVGLYD
jgi:hypothetical protein